MKNCQDLFWKKKCFLLIQGGELLNEKRFSVYISDENVISLGILRKSENFL